MTDSAAMQQAIVKAREGIALGQSPFGAVVVQDRKVVAAAHNTVWLTGDPTAHAEVNAIRAAAQALGSISLKGSTVYTTCEPCPMCLAAIHWAKITRVVFGATIADAAAAGFSELHLAAGELARLGRSPVQVHDDVLREECVALFTHWLATGKGRAY